MNAEIINIGDELLIGQVVNTNASWLASEMNKAGISVVQITTIADDDYAIKAALDQASERAQIIIISGGLGPTRDDITKKSLAEYFNSEMIFDEGTFENVKKIFSLRHYEVTEVNKMQALIPEKCIPLQNNNGTAPGMWFEKDDKVFVSLPGVPYELKSLFSDEVIVRLAKRYKLGAVVHKTIMTTGVGESFLAAKIKDWEDNLPPYVKLAYLPQPGLVRLRLSAKGPDKQALENELQQLTEALKQYVPEVIYGYDDMSLEEAIGNLLKEKGKTIATAESCTGGYIAHLITSIAGSSDYYKGSIISYSNEVKMNLLGVSSASLEEYGAVSQDVVEQMATGARERLKTDYAMATSGIAGPDGGTEEKPVGTTWIALAGPNGVISQRFHFGEHRGRNIRRSALVALNMLRMELIK
ncbi:MAG: competence/damage-inducible protein A [Bacteroidales bacterium]|nr:competence/damage-inducible protein A [Bacteroidales bacterium]